MTGLIIAVCALFAAFIFIGIVSNIKKGKIRNKYGIGSEKIFEDGLINGAVMISIPLFLTMVIIVLTMVKIFDDVLNNPNEPKAIDVYQGKTELKIDGYQCDTGFVAKDTVVIFKSEYER